MREPLHTRAVAWGPRVSSHIVSLMVASDRGDHAAAETLFGNLYAELRKMASASWPGAGATCIQISRTTAGCRSSFADLDRSRWLATPPRPNTGTSAAGRATCRSLETLERQVSRFRFLAAPIGKADYRLLNAEPRFRCSFCANDSRPSPSFILLVAFGPWNSISLLRKPSGKQFEALHY